MCEMLHCSPSELPQRCPNIIDEPLIMSYLARKVELESQAIESGKK